MFHLIASFVWIFITWRWADWRNWKQYHATILYVIACDLLHNFLLYSHPLWMYTATQPLPNHTVTNLLVMFVIYSCSVLLYLTYFPKGLKQIFYILFWVLIWSFVEWILKVFGLMIYYNGWVYWYSVLFNIVLFSLVRVHYKNPLLAYLITAAATIFILLVFNVPISKMK